MLRVRPITSRSWSRIGRRSLFDQAARTIEIAPGGERRALPAIFLPDELDRFIGHHYEGPDDASLSALFDPAVRYGPTLAYRLDDVLVADGTLLGPRAALVLRSGNRRRLISRIDEDLGEGLLCSDYFTERYFAHWLVDGLSAEQVARDRGFDPLVLARAPMVHTSGYRALTALSARELDVARVRQLWVLNGYEPTGYRVAMVERNRASIRRGVVVAGGSDRVFISRGATGVGRRRINEDDVITALAGEGFTILRPEQSTAEEVARTLRDARILVGVEGSALAHGIMALPPGAGILALQPPTAFNMMWKARGEDFGLRFGFTIGDPAGENDFTQPVDRLLRTVDSMARQL